MNEDFLKQLRKSPRREFTNELYQRINKPMPKQSVFNTTLFRRAALAFGAIVLLLTATMLFSPSARAFAGEQIRQIGAIIFAQADNTTFEEAPLQPTIPAPKGLTAEFAETAAEASELAGFTVIAPGYLPAGFEQRGTWSVDERNGNTYVVATYVAEGGRHFLMMNQTRFADDAIFEQDYGANESLTDVMVGEYEAVYISGRLMTHPDRSADSDLIPTNWLIWEADGITYTLFGNALDMDQLIQIAESLSS
jgi:hypothetical protein